MGLVIGVGSAIVAGVTAASTIAAAGFVTLTAALEITAAVGATLGVIGSITGNKDLSMAGLALGIVGGVGSLASAAGLFGDAAGTAPLFGTAASDAVTPLAGDAGAAAEAIGGDAGAAGLVPDPGAAIANGATAAADPGAAVASGTGAGTGNTDIINSIGQANADRALPQTAIAGQTEQAAGNAGDIVTGGDQTSPLASAINTPSAQAGVPTGTTTPSIPGVTVPGAPVPAGEGIDPITGLPATAADIPGMKPPVPGDGGILGSLTSFAKSNPMATYGLIQAAGSFAQGAFSPVTPAQVSALNAQAAANNAAAGLTNRQVANMNSGVPSATVNRSNPGTSQALPVASPPVTGQPQGLINRQGAAA